MGRTKGSKNGIRRVVIKTPGSNQTTYKYVSTHKLVHRDISKHSKSSSSSSLQQPTFNADILNLYRCKKYEKCAKSIENYLKSHDGNHHDVEHYRILLAATKIMLENFTEAHQLIDDVISSNPKSSFAYYNKGVAFYFQKQFDLSISMFDKAIQINPSAQMNRAREMKMRIDLENRKAIIVLEKMKLEESEIEDLLLVQGDENLANEKTPTKLNQRASRTRRGGGGGGEDNQNDRNIPNIPEALPKSFIPRTSEDYYKKAQELYVSGSLQSSLNSFEKSFELDPKHLNAREMSKKIENFISLLEKMRLNLENEEFENVIELATEALTIDSQNHYLNCKFFYHRGLALYRLGKNEESLKDYAKYEKAKKLIDDENLTI